jgi:hypothetical protein
MDEAEEEAGDGEGDTAWSSNGARAEAELSRRPPRPGLNLKTFIKKY